MREVRNTVQSGLWEPQGAANHSREHELTAISDVLDERPQLSELVFEDLRAVRETKASPRGAKGLSAAQVLRVLIVKQMFDLPYRDLSFFIFDSTSLRRFCRFAADAKAPSRSGLAGVIKALKSETLEAINRTLLEVALERGIEDGETVRGDCTVVETNIHRPTDSHLLWDGVRVITGYVLQAKKIVGPAISFTDRSAEAKRLHVQVAFAHRNTQRRDPYTSLIALSQEILAQALSQLPTLRNPQGSRRERRQLQRLLEKLEHQLPLLQQVIDQTHRRVIDGESVPASEKLFSIFEEHTNVIRKGSRDTKYGHKICLTAGEFLVLDCEILEGNPADSTLVERMIDRQAEIYGRLPKQVAFDGGFASLQNLEDLKAKTVEGTTIQDIAFAKKRGLKVEEMTRSAGIYRQLRNFRAGIESLISFLKRCFGLTRCTWKSFESFKSYVWSSIVAANLLAIARRSLATA